MKSIKELAKETKLLEKIEKYPNCKKITEYLFQDVELKEMQDYANNVSIKRLGFNDHGPVHMRQVTINAFNILRILNEAGIKTSLEQEEVGTFEDSLCAVLLAGLMHDLGMMAVRQGHEDMSVMFAMPIIDRTLNEVFQEDIHKKVIIKALAIECIIGHMSSRKIHSLEAGVLMIADGCDMTKGRARIPLSINFAPKAGDIHKYSANAITHVAIHHGQNKPVKIDIEMSSDVGFFQIEEVLLPKVNASPAKQYIEIYAGVSGLERKCYL